VNVLPLIEPTAPTTSRPPRGCGHCPFDEGMSCTLAALTVPLLASLPRAGRTTTQLPVVTSDSWAGAIDEILVELPKSTVALPFCCAT
jgi:hypothetical protein